MDNSNLSDKTTVQPPASVPSPSSVAPSASRRRLLKQAAVAAPVVLTLRSGAVMARTSSCLDEAGFMDNLVPADQAGKYVCLGGGGFANEIETIDGVEYLRCGEGGVIVTASSAASYGADFCD